MGCFILLLLLVSLVFVGVGFAFHLLWIVALIFFAFWLAGFAFEKGRRRGGRGSRRT